MSVAVDAPAAAQVELIIPSQPEFVGVARLAVLGVASRMRFSYDEVEDIRLAVGEACTRCIDRLAGTEMAGRPMRLTCFIQPDELTLEMRIPLVPEVETPESDGKELSGVLIDILMDEVSSVELPAEGQWLFRMTKRVAS